MAECGHEDLLQLSVRPESGYLTEIRDTPQEQYEEILTDDPALYEEIRAFLERSCPQALSALRLYQDSAVSSEISTVFPRRSGKPAANGSG